MYFSKRDRTLIEKQARTANAYLGKGIILAFVWGLEFGGSDFSLSAKVIRQLPKGMDTVDINVDIRKEDDEKDYVSYTFLGKQWDLRGNIIPSSKSQLQ